MPNMFSPTGPKMTTAKPIIANAKIIGIETEYKISADFEDMIFFIIFAFRDIYLHSKYSSFTALYIAR